MESPLIQLSQSHLNLLSLCPRKYQHTYLDQFLVPTASSHKDKQEQLGQQFHLIMQQHWMGLNVTPILETSPHLNARFQAFQAHPPQIIKGKRITEHQRKVRLNHYLLVGIFDLLALNDTQGQIIDWKSYTKPKSPKQLQTSWQTKLYLYLLAETTHLAPPQISITYWFAETQTPKDSHTYSFQYSESRHRETHQEIKTRLSQLDHWLNGYTQTQALPQAEFDQGHCISATYQCPYLYRCQRSPQSDQDNPNQIYPSSWETAFNIDAISEIPL